VRVAVVAIASAFALIFAVTAKAHILKVNAPTPGGKIIQLENRVYHDESVIKHRVKVKLVKDGEWSQIVKFQINRYELYEHRKDLKVAKPLLAHYRSLIGNESAWKCIHSHEASWTDTGDPYWGGLQMDRQFMRTYGYWLYTHIGTADKWNKYDQMIVAEKARRSGRGYYPWPNTARYCGLI
jgi:hypothetical protein